MNWFPYNTWIVLQGVTLLGTSAGVIGCFAFLRRRSLTGDALSHASLPGICLAFLIVGERSLIELLMGAFLAGVLGIAVISALRRWTRIKEDAAIGIVLSVFFGAGIVLSSMIQRWPGGSRAGLESFILGKTAGMTADEVHFIRLLAVGTVLNVILFYKEFKIISFDPDFARVQGCPALALDLLMMALIAVTVVIGLPAVGVVMMAALLILPAAAARFWTDRLAGMLLLAALFGMTAGAGGVFFSDRLAHLPAGPSIILVAAGLFVFSLILGPRRGLLARFS